LFDDGRIDSRAMDVETSEAIEQLGQRIDALEVSLRTEFRAGLAENRRHAESLFADSRRHTEVLVEALRDDIRTLAEGFATLSAELDSGR
jgi:hypothetical protein